MPTHSTASRREAPAPLLDDTTRRRLGARLRADYAPIERAPLPDEQIDLLLQLRHKERERRSKAG